MFTTTNIRQVAHTHTQTKDNTNNSKEKETLIKNSSYLLSSFSKYKIDKLCLISTIYLTPLRS